MTLDTRWSWLWGAFMALSPDRPRVGMSGVPGPIAWRDIRDWCRDRGIIGPDYDLMGAAMRALDDRYIAAWIAKQPKS